ncbi:MAG: tRNA pseudouridine(55) synthase TruB [Chloroflexi bacterium]|nr:tRNA pseudouridine(55) synthase TruB [Chloroflexota bacterium]
MGHSLEGILNIDKPIWLSSHAVVNRIRRVGNLRRVGHAGTLDPLATGVLIVCLGRATRLVEYVMGQRKVYEATVRLGQTTNTYDAEGEVVTERPFSHITPALLAQTLDQFRGPIKQQPPMYSAIKKDGQPLYKLARQGIEVERPLRDVTIYQLDLLSMSLPDINLRICCSTGTYIRSLAHDMGELLNCGGHITALRRTAIGEFGIGTAVSLDHLTPDNINHYLQPMDTAVAHLPQINFSAPDAARLLLGQTVENQTHHPKADFVSAYDEQGAFLGIIEQNKTVWKAKKMFLPIEQLP